MAVKERHWSDKSRAKKKLWRRVIWFASLVGALAILTALLYWIIYGDWLNVNSVEIVGEHSMSQEYVESFAEETEFENSWGLFRVLGPINILFWKNKTIENPAKFPLLRKIEIKKSFWQRTVKISVVDREPYGIWCIPEDHVLSGEPRESVISAKTNLSYRLAPYMVGTNCHWFDEDGVVFRAAPFAEGGSLKVIQDYSARKIILGQHVLNPDFWSKMQTIFKIMDAYGLEVSEYRLGPLNLEEVAVMPQNGMARIFFSLRFIPAQVADVLKSLDAKPGLNKLQYVDFRSENRVFYK